MGKRKPYKSILKNMDSRAKAGQYFPTYLAEALHRLYAEKKT